MNHYDVLQVHPSSTFDEIKIAYRTAARLYHPDKRHQRQQLQNRRQDQHQHQPQQDRQHSTIHDDDIIIIQKRSSNHIGKFNDNNDNRIDSNFTNSNTQVKFQQIQVAWECLRNFDTRQKYDQYLYRTNQLIQSKYQNAIPIDISDCIEQPTANNDDVVLLYTCRCGYVMNTSELDIDDDDEFDGNDNDEDVTNQVIFSCSGCSLTYSLNIVT